MTLMYGGGGGLDVHVWWGWGYIDAYVYKYTTSIPRWIYLGEFCTKGLNVFDDDDD